MGFKNNHGGARRGAGRKKGTKTIPLITNIEKHCKRFIEEILQDEAIRYNAVKQLSLSIEDQNNKRDDYFYIIENEGLYKLGYSSNFNKRIKVYETHSADVNLVYVTKQFDCFSLEQEIHQYFKDERISGEWFKLSNTDVFSIIKYCSERLIKNK